MNSEVRQTLKAVVKAAMDAVMEEATEGYQGPKGRWEAAVLTIGHALASGLTHDELFDYMHTLCLEPLSALRPATITADMRAIIASFMPVLMRKAQEQKQWKGRKTRPGI